MYANNYKKLNAKFDGYQNIMTELMTNGPVEAAFVVYQDFFSYSYGV